MIYIMGPDSDNAKGITPISVRVPCANQLAGGEPMINRSRWRVGNDTPVWYSPRRHVYFLWRENDQNQRKDFVDQRGRLRTWRTFDEAKKKADTLNEVN